MRFTHRCVVVVATVVVAAVCPQLPAADDDALKTDSVIAALDARATQFLDGVSAGQTQRAFADLLAGSQLSRQTDALKDLVTRTNDLESKYGAFRASERISAKRIGNDLVLMRYLYKCEEFPVVWYFTFYRAPGTGAARAKSGVWRVVAVRFDTELEQL